MKSRRFHYCAQYCKNFSWDCQSIQFIILYFQIPRNKLCLPVVFSLPGRKSQLGKSLKNGINREDLRPFPDPSLLQQGNEATQRF